MKNPPRRIAIVGLGSAGRARQRALEGLEGFELAAYVSRRPGMGDRSFEEVLAESGSGAGALSTESADHPASVLRSLNACKQVLCDYPLAFSAAEARKLYRLADQKNKLLHVEHLSILSKAHRIFKTNAKALGKLLQGEFVFQADWRPALQDVSRQGPFPFLAESRLVQLTDLFGDFEVMRSDWKGDAEKAYLFLKLRFSEGGVLDFWEKRSPGSSRERSFRGRFEHGEYAWPGVVEPPGLFRKDLEIFGERVTSRSASYYDETLMFQVLENLAQISKGKV